MGLNKMVLITLLVIVISLVWPQMLVKFYINQLEQDIVWRNFIRIASEDAAMVLKNSSYGYGKKGERINEFDTFEAINTFQRSLNLQSNQDLNLINYSINQKVPLIIIFEPSGYVVNYSSSIWLDRQTKSLTTEKSNGKTRISLPLKRYMIEDENAYYYLDQGQYITCVAKQGEPDKHKEIISGLKTEPNYYLEVEITDVLSKVKGSSLLSATYPLLSESESDLHVRYLFLRTVFDDLENLLSQMNHIYSIGTIQALSNAEMLSKFEFSGIVPFMSKPTFGSKRINLDAVDCFQNIRMREDVLGYIVNGNREYCSNGCKKHSSDNLVAIFPDYQTAAEYGFLPCDFPFKRENN